MQPIDHLIPVCSWTYLSLLLWAFLAIKNSLCMCTCFVFLLTLSTLLFFYFLFLFFVDIILMFMLLHSTFLVSPHDGKNIMFWLASAYVYVQLRRCHSSLLSLEYQGELHKTHRFQPPFRPRRFSFSFSVSFVVCWTT